MSKVEPTTLQELRRAAVEAAVSTEEGRREQAERSHEEFQRELAGERAAALGRAGRKIDDAFASLAAAEAAWDAGQVPYGRYAAAWREAYEARWEMEVLREAIGLVRHDVVYEHWPLPLKRPDATG